MLKGFKEVQKIAINKKWKSWSVIFNQSTKYSKWTKDKYKSKYYLVLVFPPFAFKPASIHLGTLAVFVEISC